MHVVNLRRKPWPFAFVYVGRAFAGFLPHPLGNPFKIKTEAERASAVERYREWLLARPDLEQRLAEVRDDCEHGRAPLACWCCEWRLGEPVRVPCHAIVIAEEIAKRWPGKVSNW